MKLSNKLLLGFFGLIFLYFTAAFTEIRLRGTPYILDDESSIAETVDITGVNYLILSDLKQKIHVIGSDTPRFEVRSISGDLLHNLTYEVSRNTLNLSELNLDEDQSIKISIYVSKRNFTGMTVKGADVTIQGLDQDELHIDQHKGWISMNDKNIIGKLNLKASMANFNISNTTLDTLGVELENSKMVILSPVKFLKGSITESSSLQLSSIHEIQFKKDTTSSLYINEIYL